MNRNLKQAHRLGVSLWTGIILNLSSVSGLEEIHFSRDVLPILSDHCFQCHGPDAKEGRKGDLRLDVEADAKRQRAGYQVIKSGDPQGSELLRRLTTSDPDERMPPPDHVRRVSPDQIQLLTRWIAEGAHWGQHWAFEPIVRPETSGLEAHPIDELVARRLEKAGIPATALAPAEMRIRRVHLDLTGLPPDPDEAAEFVKAPTPEAWDRVVDKVLASEHFGERLAWDWLEAARYADTNGYQGDGERTMWPWRDWVVRAYNENVPFDEFTVWQLAGDLLPSPTRDQVLATGFNRNHMINGEGGRIPEENRVDYVLDMTETMGTVWLGLTLNCCRCHDHKFDPILQKEYYQFTAFFNQTPVTGGGGSGRTPPLLNVPTDKQNLSIRNLQNQISEIQSDIQHRQKILKSQQADWETRMLDQDPTHSWSRITAAQAQAQFQNLSLQPDGSILASGANPDNDRYRIHFQLTDGISTGFQLEAWRHPSMTQGGLARSDSGNFVLTDIRFSLLSASNPEASQPIPVAPGQASFEQPNHSLAMALDNDPQSGWAVWSGKPIDRDHFAIFIPHTPVKHKIGDILEVTLEFNSPHKNHNLGLFGFSTTQAGHPSRLRDWELVEAALKTPAEKRNDSQIQLLQRVYFESDRELAELEKRQQSLTGSLKSVEGQVAQVMVMKDLESPRATHILDRGLYNQPRGEVKPDIPQALPRLGMPLNPDRLDLARWLVHKDHPLTARVYINRLWQMLFGTGLVKTVEDFGVQAEFPIHRELLDWLAAEFIESGWNLKHLLKTIVTSQTYQLSSEMASPSIFEMDPENRLLARGSRYRMPSWMIRDNALAAAAILNRQPGGPPVFPYQPNGVWAEATFGNKSYTPSSGENLHRRSLYTFWRRIVGPTLFFDSAKRQVCEVKVLRTNTPMHALTVLNDTTYVEAARCLAQRACQSAQSEEEVIQRIFQLTLLRRPAIREVQILMHSYNKAKSTFSQNPHLAQEFLSNGVTPLEADMDLVDWAAWTAVCLNVLNLDESLTRE